MKVAIVHDWLVTYAGAERVLEQILLLYPEADLYSLVDFMPEAERAFLRGRRPRTSFLQRMPFAQVGELVGGEHGRRGVQVGIDVGGE